MESPARKVTYPTATAFCLTSAFWFFFGTFVGLIMATELVAPDVTNLEWLLFGRIRQIHVNIVLFGFVTSGLLAAAFYFFPILLRTQLYSERLGIFSAIVWNVGLAAIPVSLALGHNHGREYAEMIWPIDVIITSGFVLVFVNLWMTALHRKEPLLYVSVWYIFAAVVLTAITFPLGNVIWRPGVGALTGMPDAILQWFYGHNIFGLLLTPLAIGVAYYVIPKAIKRPLYSHTLSLIGFWSIIVIYAHIGTHHLLQAPVPTWLKVIAVTDSIGMVIPVMVFLINIWYTAKGKLGEIHADIPAKFAFTGTIMYFFVSIQGSMMSLPVVQRVTHFNNWVVGHAHIGVLAFSGMIALGGLYSMLPGLTGRPVHNKFLMDLQYWLVLIGVSSMSVVLTIAGLIQGNSWLNGETVYRTIPTLQIYYVLRGAFGFMIFSAAALGLYNIAMSIFSKRSDLS